MIRTHQLAATPFGELQGNWGLDVDDGGGGADSEGDV